MPYVYRTRKQIAQSTNLIVKGLESLPNLPVRKRPQVLKQCIELLKEITKELEGEYVP